MSWVITGTETVTQDLYLYTNTVLLLKGDGTNGSTTILDSSKVAGGPKTVTAFGNAQISTAQSKFGGASIFFDGTTDYLTAASTDFVFGTNDFTIECWVRTSSTADDGIFQISNNSGGFKTTNESGPLMGINAGILRFALNSGDAVTSTGATINDAQWHHIAMSRSGTSLKAFVDGITVSTVANSINCTGQFLCVAGYYSTTFTLNGNIDDFRITKGIARYTANFTPPTAPFPDI
jgi:hypothetical protein